jgi:hypothetical protein
MFLLAEEIDKLLARKSDDVLTELRLAEARYALRV